MAGCWWDAQAHECREALLFEASAFHDSIVLTSECGHPALLLLCWEGEKGISLHSPELVLDEFEWVMLVLLFQVSNLATPSNSSGQ